MATSVTIAPTLGEAVLFTEDGVGDSTGYHWIDVRRAVQAGSALQEGVFDATGWKVTQRGAGANMTVDVASSTGLAVVQGDSVTHQSRFVVAPHSAVANLDIGANATGNPRVDQVILQVRDHANDGSGSNDARVLVLAGTATSGATLDNRTGAASLPASAIRLADVLVASGASSITDAVIRDRRLWAKGAYNRIIRTSADYTTTSASNVEVDTTNLKPRIECSGAPIRLSVYGTLNQSGANNIYMAFFQDGALLDALNHVATLTGTSTIVPAWQWETVPSAGSHQFSPAWRTNSGTATLYASAAWPLVFTVEEIVRPNANNG